MTLERFYIPFVAEPQKLMTWTGVTTFDEAHLTARGVSRQIVEALRLAPRYGVEIVSPQVEVSCKGNRLFSQVMHLKIGGHPVRAYGTVSLDGTMEYWVDFLPTEGLVGAEWFPALRNERIKVPLIGTAREPHLDMDTLNAEIARLKRERN